MYAEPCTSIRRSNSTLLIDQSVSCVFCLFRRPADRHAERIWIDAGWVTFVPQPTLLVSVPSVRRRGLKVVPKSSPIVDATGR